jgi:hypothetical protein
LNSCLIRFDLFFQFIVIHARHGDFFEKCGSNGGKCIPPLSMWANQVETLRAELLAQKGVQIERVIMTSDETSEQWWEKIEGLGWNRINHARMGTVEKYGKW